MAGGEHPEAQVARHVGAGAGRSDLTSGAAQVLQRAGAWGPGGRLAVQARRSTRV